MSLAGGESGSELVSAVSGGFEPDTDRLVRGRGELGSGASSKLSSSDAYPVRILLKSSRPWHNVPLPGYHSMAARRGKMVEGVHLPEPRSSLSHLQMTYPCWIRKQAFINEPVADNIRIKGACVGKMPSTWAGWCQSRFDKPQGRCRSSTSKACRTSILQSMSVYSRQSKSMSKFELKSVGEVERLVNGGHELAPMRDTRLDGGLEVPDREWNGWNLECDKVAPAVEHRGVCFRG